jgi:hypothetical protein
MRTPPFFFKVGVVVAALMALRLRTTAATEPPLLLLPYQHEPDRPIAFAAALNSTFMLQSRSSSVGGHPLCRKRLLDLMRRQRIPVRLESLRALPDADLYRIALMSAVGGVGQWKRDELTDALLLDEQGTLLRAFVPNTVESDVMLCIICALLTVIAIHHIILGGVPTAPAPAPAPSSGVAAATVGAGGTTAGAAAHG